MKRLNRGMVNQLSVGLALIGLMASTAIASTPVCAQYLPTMEPSTDVSMCLYPVERGADGVQYIITRAGFKVTVPGLGIAPDAREIAVYRNPENQFWYVNKNGATVPVTAFQVQWTMAQINHQQALRNIENERERPLGEAPIVYNSMGQQVAQQPTAIYSGMAPNVIINNEQPATRTATSGAGAAVVTGLAAAGGSMLGSMIGSSFYDNNNGYDGIPYGHPCYNEGGHYYYNGADGAHEVPANRYTNQWDRQQAYQYNSQNRQNAYNNLNENQQQMLKNQGYEDMKNRNQAQALSEEHGGTAREGDEALHDARFGGFSRCFGDVDSHFGGGFADHFGGFADRFGGFRR
jgi:hypothetical protein